MLTSLYTAEFDMSADDGRILCNYGISYVKAGDGSTYFLVSQVIGDEATTIAVPDALMEEFILRLQDAVDDVDDGINHCKGCPHA